MARNGTEWHGMAREERRDAFFGLRFSRLTMRSRFLRWFSFSWASRCEHTNAKRVLLKRRALTTPPLFVYTPRNPVAFWWWWWRWCVCVCGGGSGW